MEKWQRLLDESITSWEELSRKFSLESSGIDEIISTYPMRINPYYLGLIKEVGDPMWLQAVPDKRELHDTVCMADPLDEENLSPVVNLVHKYPDRVLFLVNSSCALYCRFCTRKRKVGTSQMIINHQSLIAGIDYIKNNRNINDVLLSGGDPLLLRDDKIDWLLNELRKIKHVEIIRIGTRVPCVLPSRVTEKLAGILKKYHPLYINTHFNHPDEITSESAEACTRLADAGIPLGCQTVLLRGVNDNSHVIRKLMRDLLRIRVKPYYLFQGDMTRGTNHFRTDVNQGIEIMKSLIGHTSGMAVPTFALDAPGGGGKVPISPKYIDEISAKFTFRNYCGKTYSYVNGGG